MDRAAAPTGATPSGTRFLERIQADRLSGSVSGTGTAERRLVLVIWQRPQLPITAPAGEGEDRAYTQSKRLSRRNQGYLTSSRLRRFRCGTSWFALIPRSPPKKLADEQVGMARRLRFFRGCSCHLAPLDLFRRRPRAGMVRGSAASISESTALHIGIPETAC
jgi:hypothetical protein